MMSLFSSNFPSKSGSEIRISWKISEPPALMIGVIPYFSAERVKQELAPLVNFLALNLKRPVIMNVASDYELLGKMLDFKLVHVAWFSSVSFSNLNREGRWEILCRPCRLGKVQHQGDIIVRSDSGIKCLADLKGKTFAYVDRNSGTGFAYTNRLLAREGIDPLNFFGKVEFTGNHSNSIQGVLSGKYDAAGTFDISMNLSSSALASITVLAQTEKIFNDPIVVRKDLEPELKNKLLDLFVNMPKYASGTEMLIYLNSVLKWQKFISEDEVKKYAK